MEKKAGQICAISMALMLLFGIAILFTRNAVLVAMEFMSITMFMTSLTILCHSSETKNA